MSIFKIGKAKRKPLKYYYILTYYKVQSTISNGSSSQKEKKWQKKKLIIHKIGNYIDYDYYYSWIGSRINACQPFAQNCRPILFCRVHRLALVLAKLRLDFISLIRIQTCARAHAKSQSIITDYFVFVCVVHFPVTAQWTICYVPLRNTVAKWRNKFCWTTIKIVILLHNNWVCRRMYHFMRFARVLPHILILRSISFALSSSSVSSATTSLPLIRFRCCFCFDYCCCCTVSFIVDAVIDATYVHLYRRTFWIFNFNREICKLHVCIHILRHIQKLVTTCGMAIMLLHELFISFALAIRSAHMMHVRCACVEQKMMAHQIW